ncbi:hypothetical protein GCM10010467_08400 [Actinocorallia glomerata]|uniref:Uncharacterized protein n=2 Tax=Actinomycetes TaxID=1760 RepID=A0ABP6LSY8_9MICC
MVASASLDPSPRAEHQGAVVGDDVDREDVDPARHHGDEPTVPHPLEELPALVRGEGEDRSVFGMIEHHGMVLSPAAQEVRGARSLLRLPPFFYIS